jgi:hypothetical protein
MADNKRHHYVPQFYLRNFGAGNSIALFNIRQRRHIHDASIPGQCQRAYLYGRDQKIERELARLEADASGAIGRIIASAPEDVVSDDDEMRLLFFTLYQWGRTTVAGAAMNERTSLFAQEERDDGACFSVQQGRFGPGRD